MERPLRPLLQEKAMSKDKPDTKVVSAGRMSEEHFGAVNTPVYRASTILYPDLARHEGQASQPYTYGRRGTPSSQSLEDAIAELEGGAPDGAGAVGPQCRARRRSCRCAAAAIIFWWSTASMSPTRHFCDTTLKRFGVETRLLRAGRRHRASAQAQHQGGVLRKPRLADLRDPGHSRHRPAPRMPMAPPC